MAGNVIASLLLGIATKADTSGLNKTESGLKKLGNTAKRVSTQTSLLSKITGGLFGGVNIHAIKGMFDSYLQFEKDLGAMKSRFFAITKDEAKAEEEFEYIRKLATDTANDIKATADSYSIFYTSARRSLGEEGARGVFEAWTKVGRVLHLNEQQFERVTYALREMSSKGQLYSQDLKMQLGTHVPDAVNIATEAIQNLNIAGVDTIEKFQELTKAQPKGGYMAKFLIEFSKVAQGRYGSDEAVKKALQQPDAVAQAIKNMGANFLIEFSKRGGGYMIVKILQGIKDALLKIDYNKLATVLGSMAKGIANIFGFLLKNIKSIIILLQTMIAIRMFNAVRGILGPLAQSFGAFGIAGTSKLARLGLFGPIGQMFSRALLLFGSKFGLKVIGGTIGRIAGLLTGPWGLAITAIITFLPQIFKGLSWIWSKLSHSTPDIRGRLAEAGVSEQQFRSVAKILQEKVNAQGGIMSEDEVRRIAGYYIKDKDIQQMFTINDKSKILVNVSGTEVTVDKALSYDTNKGSKESKVSKYNNVPSSFRDL